MLYKVIAKRYPRLNGKMMSSRVEFIEEADMPYNEYWLKTLEDFPSWIVNVSTVKDIKNERSHL